MLRERRVSSRSLLLRDKPSPKPAEEGREKERERGGGWRETREKVRKERRKYNELILHRSDPAPLSFSHTRTYKSHLQ